MVGLSEAKNFSPRTEIGKAREGFAPEVLGFKAYGRGWEKEIPGIGTVAFAPLGWQHNQMTSGGLTALQLHGNIQQAVWNLSELEVIPGHLLSIVGDTGGVNMVAYLKDKGFTEDGWLGYALGFGGTDGLLISHQLAVRPELQGADIGRNLKLLQAADALSKGHTRMQWTYDPMRGNNARLNLEKLGGIVKLLTVDKYGIIAAEIYSADPTHRFTVEWDFLSESVQNRIHQVEAGQYTGLTLDEVQDIPIVTVTNLEDVRQAPSLRYEIPVTLNEDRLSKQERIIWRQDMVSVLGQLLTTMKAGIPSDYPFDPAMIQNNVSQGGYIVTGFATDKASQSFYVLQIK